MPLEFEPTIRFRFATRIKDEVKRAYNYRCAISGQTGSKEDPLEVHHRVPLELNGSDSPYNAVPLKRSIHEILNHLAVDFNLIYNPKTRKFEDISQVSSVLFDKPDIRGAGI